MKSFSCIVFLLGSVILVSKAAANTNNNDPILVGSNTAYLSNLNASDYFASLLPDDDEDRTTYLDWLQDTSYMKHTFLPMVTDPSNGAAVLWKLFTSTDVETTSTAAVSRNNNKDYTHIQVAVAVRATGWVGFGISEAGGMLGSDIALFETAFPNTIRDSYVIEDLDVPKKDDCQHWTLLNYIADNGWLIVEMSRPLDTLDNQDHAIVDDSRLPTPTRLIAAWGDTPAVSYHGFQVGKISTKIFPIEENDNEADTPLGGTYAKDFEEVMEEQADGYFEILADNFTIPARDTTYHYICKSYDELKAQYDLPDTENGILTFIGGGAVLSPETQQYVHHFIVYGSTNPNPTEEECGQGAMLWGWAPGEEPQALPENIGIPLFDPNGNFRSISVEIHYNNPAELDGLVDSSGFRFYFSTQPREVEAAWLAVGDPATLLNGQPIGEGLTEYSFTCASDCSSTVLGSESVTVIAETLHMHQTGVRMTNELIRDGEVANFGAVEVFEFDQQGSFKVQQDLYEIKPGDSFRTTCYYRDGTEFGFSSQEEMCVAFLLYYPAKKIDFGSFGSFPWMCLYGIDSLPICKEELEIQSLESVEGLGRRFGVPTAQCSSAGNESSSNDTITPGGSEQQIDSSCNKNSFTACLFLMAFTIFIW